MMSKKINEKEIGLITGAEFKSLYIKFIYAIFFVVLLILSLICVAPILWVFLSAFKDLDEFLQIPPTIIPKTFNLSKLPEVWNQLKIGKYYINSLVYVCGCLFFDIMLNGLAGYTLSKARPKGYKIADKLVFLCMLLPTSMNMIPLYMSFSDLPLLHINILNTYLPMWLMYGVAPFTIMLFKKYFDGIPKALSEAAKIDGCSELGIFARIIMPLSKPIVLVVAILCINTAWADFMWPYLIVNDPDKMQISVIVYNMKESMSIDKYFVVLLLSILPSIAIFAVFGRKMMGGLVVGGVKG